MITTFLLYQRFCGEANTHQFGHLKPSVFTDWANTISIDIFNDLVEEFEKTKVISDKLTPFLLTDNRRITPMPNQMWDLVVLPDDYNYYAAGRVIIKEGKSCGCKGLPTESELGDCTLLDEDELEEIKMQADKDLCEYTVTKVRNAQWSAICAHATLKPTLNSPKCTKFDKGLKIAPKGLGIMVLDYFRKPVPATFLFTITNPGEEDEYFQYLTTSQPLEWDEKMIPEFLARLEEKYGKFKF